MGLELADVMGNTSETPETGNEGSEPSPSPEAPTTEAVEAQESEGSEQEQGEAAEPLAADGQNTGQDAEGGTKEGPVPYDRFRQKVSQVHELKETLELQQQRIQALEALQKGQSAGVSEPEPEPEEADPLLERLETLDDEYSSNPELVGVVKDMASELKKLRAQAATSSESVQKMRVKERVKVIEASVAKEAESAGVHDKDGARTFVFEALSRDTSGDVSELMKRFADWERQQEEVVLSRLGLSRDAAKAAPGKEPDAPPSRAMSSSGGKQAHGGQSKQKKEAPKTLREMRRSFTVNRR